MTRLLRHPVFCGSVALIATLLAAEVWQFQGARRAETRARRSLARKQQEWRKLSTGEAIPAEEQAANIAADLARAEDELARLEESLGRFEAGADVLRGEAATRPASRAEAFFALADFRRRLHEQAGRAGVKVSAEECFGFSEYVHAGPEPEAIAAIHRQRLMVERLVNVLLASGPTELAAVQRERLPGAAADGGRRPGGNAPAGTDLFALDPRLSMRKPGLIDGVGFRLTFLGYTAGLRGFVNRLAQAADPWVIRWVEAAPVREPPGRKSGSSDGVEPLVALVRPALSRFTVIVEFCDLGGTKARPAPAMVIPGKVAERPQTSPPWGPPAAQSRGRGWVYDVFTPPAVYLDRRTNRLNAIPAAGTAEDEAAGPEFDLELLEIRPGLFRLQLVGFAGDAENLRGIFVDPDTGETVVGHRGERLAGRGLTLKNLGLERDVTAGVANTEVRAMAAVAVVIDEFTGAEVRLTSREPCCEGAPLGLFASRRTEGFRRELQAGESVALGGMSYCVERLELEAQRAVIACLPPDGRETLVRTLTAKRIPSGPPVEAGRGGG